MTSWKQAGRRALWSGSMAAMLSALTLAVCGAVERKRPAGPMNGPSQWLFGERAAHRRRASLRHTASGYAIHHGASLGWATLHHKHVADLVGRTSMPRRLTAAAATATLAYLVDYHLVRGRLQPGFDKQLSGTSLLAVYASFAVGLALGDLMETHRRL